MSDPGVQRMAETLAVAWQRYREFFDCEPHGTVKQMAALIELSPQLKFAIRLFEKEREEGMTVLTDDLIKAIGSRFADREPSSGAWDEPFRIVAETIRAQPAAPATQAAEGPTCKCGHTEERHDRKGEWSKRACRACDCVAWERAAQPADSAPAPEQKEN